LVSAILRGLLASHQCSTTPPGSSRLNDGYLGSVNTWALPFLHYLYLHACVHAATACLLRMATTRTLAPSTAAPPKMRTSTFCLPERTFASGSISPPSASMSHLFSDEKKATWRFMISTLQVIGVADQSCPIMSGRIHGDFLRLLHIFSHR